MDKNKSIDGLTPRRPKKSAVATSTPKKATVKTTNKATKTVKVAKSAKAVKPATKKVAAKATKTTKTPKTTKTIKTTAPAKAVKPAKAAVAPVSTPAPEPETPKPSKSTDATADFLKPVQAFDFDEESGQLVASKDSTSPKKGKKMKKEKKPASKKRKIILSTIITILILLIAGVIGLIFWINNKFGNITNDGNIFDFFSETYEPLKTDENGRTNILAFGTSGYDMEGNEGDGVHDGAQLTDSIMAISIDQETGDVAMLSLPRDLKASPTCTATGKINEVYWCNDMDGDNEQAGAEALAQEVGDVLGIDFQYYAHLNWGSLVSIVDAIGGITVTTDETIEYDYIGYNNENVVDVIQENTPTKLSGRASLGLARARHQTLHGDFSRGASQQKILIGIKDKILENSLSVSEMLSIVDTLGDNLRTSFSVAELKTLAHIASEFDFDNMRQISLIDPVPLVTTGTINGISYVLPVGGTGYYTNIQNYVAKMFSSDPKVHEDAAVLVLNGTDTPGIASAEQASLEEAGFPNVDISDAPAGITNAEYTLYTLTDAAPSTRKALEDKYHITAESADALPAGLATDGYDFVLILGDQPASE